MPGFTIWGVTLAVIGALLMSVENLEYIFGKTDTQADLEVRSRYGAFAPNADEYNQEVKDHKKKIRIRKIILTIGLIVLILGLGFQMLGALD